MVYRHQDLISNTWMFVQLGRFLRVDPIRSVDDLSLDGDLANIVQVSRDSSSLDLLFAPAQFRSDDLGIFSDSNRMTLRIFILSVYRRGKCLDCVVVGHPKILVELAIFVGTPLKLRHHISLCYCDADV